MALWHATCGYPCMQSETVPNGLPSGFSFRSGERRKHPRFDMHVPVFLRGMSELWMVTQTADVSAAGAFFVSERPFLLNTPVEYVLTFPPDLTKAPQPLRMRFFGTVLRCERVPEGNGAFGVAVLNTAHRYLTREEGAIFDTMEQKLSAAADPKAASLPRKTGT